MAKAAKKRTASRKDDEVKVVVTKAPTDPVIVDVNGRPKVSIPLNQETTVGADVYDVLCHANATEVEVVK